MKFPESQRVKYIRNPLMEVICQVRFPKILRIDAEVPVNFKEEISSEYPTLNTSRITDLPLPPYLSADPSIETVGRGISYEFINKEGNWQVTLSSDFIALSTLEYQGWEDFRSRWTVITDLLIKYYSPSHFTRVGLRYQDLIMRSSLNLENRSWKDLLKPPILGTFAAENLIEKDFIELLSVFACRLDYEDSTLRVRYGLARREESEELGYLIDSDFYTENLIEVNNAIHYLNRFNRESGNFFRWCITEQLHQALQPQVIT